MKKRKTKDQKKVVDYLLEISDNAIDGGEDPVGFLVLSHRYQGNLMNFLKENNPTVYWELWESQII